MPIKGPSYVKTTWAFQERPVPSAKLNAWDDRIEAALELAYRLLALVWGGGDGVIRNAENDSLQVLARASPGLAVVVRPGFAFIDGMPFWLAEETETVDVDAAVTLPRIDLVQASLAEWTVTIKTGTAAAEPVAPAPDSDCLALAHLYLPGGGTVIKNADDGTNGYIIDQRTFV